MTKKLKTKHLKMGYDKNLSINILQHILSVTRNTQIVYLRTIETSVHMCLKFKTHLFHIYKRVVDENK